MHYIFLILRNIRRNMLRSALTAVVTIVLVLVVTAVWSVLALLDSATAEKSANLRAMVTERWSIPSRMPYAYAESLCRGAARAPGDVRPTDSMTWQIYAGTLDPLKITRESVIFAIATQPEKLLTMMEGLDILEGPQREELEACVKRLAGNRRGIILGHNHARTLLRGAVLDPASLLGKRINVTGAGNQKGIDLEFEVVGFFPHGRYDTMAAFNREYLNNAYEAFQRNHHGHKHPLADRNLNIVWLKVPDMSAFQGLAGQIQSSPLYTAPPVKCETASSGYATFLGGFRDLIWGMRWLLAPACLFTILLVIANAISISVRERRLEMAVLKVIGFRPNQILAMVLGESLIFGAGSGLLGAAGAYVVVNWGLGGIAMPLALLDRLRIPEAAILWGLALGGLPALLGSLLPAWSARNVKVAEVFSKVA